MHAPSPARPTRVLFVEVNEDGTVGGSHQVLYDMVRHFDRHRIEPLVLFYQDNRFAQMLRENGIETVVWEDVRRVERAAQERSGLLNMLAYLTTAIGRRRRFLREHRIHLVHMNNSPRTGRDDWLPAARLLGIPIVASARGDATALPGVGLRPAIHRWLMTRFDLVLAVSEYIADAWRKQDVPSRRVRTVHDGVDQAKVAALGTRTREEIRASLGVPDGRLLVAMVGNVREWKGQHVVIEALARLSPAERAALYVCFIGLKRPEDEAYFQDLQARVARYGLARDLAFVGSRTDVPDIMSRSDIVIHASVKPEPGGTVVIEAMSFGAPVVAASAGGHLDYLTDEIAFIHDVTRPEELAAHLRRLAGDAALRERVIVAGKARAKQFSIDATCRKMEAAYAEVLA